MNIVKLDSDNNRAVHLVSEEGLLSILKDRGYKDTQLLRRGD